MDITQREAALAALRTWAAPGTRARLAADVWRSGEHRIAVIAEAAGVSRQTAYTDLAEHGIDPKAERLETPPMYDTITIDGFTGAERDTDPLAGIHADLRAQGLRNNGDPTDPQTQQWAEAFMPMMRSRFGAIDAAGFHNALVPYANAEAQARQEAQRALHLVEIRWHSLRTAHAWLAAHHAWLEAVHQARKAIATWQAAIDATQGRADEFGKQRKAYEIEVPPSQRVPLDHDGARIALTGLETTTIERKQITRDTLAGHLQGAA